MRSPAGTGPGAAPVACPWGCVLGAGGWSGAPPCPRHLLPGAPEAERRMRQVQAACPPLHRTAPGRAAAEPLPGQGFYCPSQPESSEGEEDDDWIDYTRSYSSPGFSFHGTNNPILCGEPLPVHPAPGFLNLGVHGLNASWRHQVTAEEAEKNAKELVAEEERMKKKAEKKKLKKKKQKDRKKQEKLKQELKSKQEAESSTSSLNSAAPADADGAEEEKGCSASSPSQSLGDGAEEGAGDQGGSVEEAEDELDLSCTFVFKARQKAGVKLQVPGKEKPTKPGAVEPNKGLQETAPEPPLPCLAAPQAPEPVPLDTSVVEQSLILAGHGNEAAQEGHYVEAVQAFTEAVKLNPREHRLFGNRSYCYEKLQQYEEALRDAQMSLSLQPNWPKGFFRKGKALRGLKRYAEAVRTFEELLRLDGAHADAAAQLQACRALLQSSAHTAGVPGGVPVLSLLEDGDPPLPLPDEWVNGSCCDTDMSGFVTVVNSRSHSKSQARATAAASSKQQQLPPHHPGRDCYPLWVGNVTSRITEKVLRDCFSRFGQIQSIRMLPGKRCAFVNFKQKASAEAAYEDMLDADLEGSRLVLQLKHPSHATPSPWQRP
ncbi:tetratricopeptide repeat protein 31 isoform X2 [Cygnus olor]|uniref:tetratricopeptide repeat protein 31 isoform X2 n=1 Tax=Cygnus olor TaxID=8869 RepID=UPI001ADE4959|nr:tetratricopeptide repeat protein 31 isoform X2 [Cygnus olor]